MRHIAVAAVIIVSTIAAGCGGIEGKIDANCDARADLEKVIADAEKTLGEPSDDERVTKEDCVRELQEARKDHEKISRMKEFEKDLEDGTTGFKQLKARCDDVDPGECLHGSGG